MVELENIRLGVRGQTLIDGASLAVARGEKLVIRGPSGCGKSSILKSLVGLIPIEGGSIRVDGIVLEAKTVGTIRQHIAFIGQEPVLGAAQVREALLLPFTFKAHRHIQPDRQKISELLARLHLRDSILDKPAAHVSGGEKQRIAIARALLLDKTVFLADEITSALDHESKEAVMNELFRPELTLVSVSHDPDWFAACGRIVAIENHNLVEVAHDR